MIREQHERTGSGQFLLDRKAAEDYESAVKMVGDVPLDEIAKFWRLHHPDKPKRKLREQLQAFLADVKVRHGEGLHYSDLKSRGKRFHRGRVRRICPLWPETARLLKEYCDDQAIELRETQALFRNHRGGPLTRFGARLILRRHAHRATAACSGLARKRIHPHCIRHSTAIHLLKAGVDLSTMAHWLGHKSIITTHKYVTIDLEAKRAAIAKAGPIVGNGHLSRRWHPREDLLKWLESL